MNMEELRAAYPDLVLLIENNAKEQGIVAERQRIQDIEKISNTIPEELVNEAKFVKPVDAKELAFLALQKTAKLGKEYLNNVTDDTTSSGADDVTAAIEAPKPEKPKTVQDKIKNMASIGSSDK